MKRFYSVAIDGELVPLSKRSARMAAEHNAPWPRQRAAHAMDGGTTGQRDRSRSKEHVTNVRRIQREAKRGLEALFA
ncbi:hypothetical protein KTE28_18505 [Burkholderia multivorans]|uniref:hypothetical protein n=1 Tax=Burkholderia multivorans TaxID=87883 RepID=UPI000D009B84|nr:hypothetical protein [Burkholderia multivorans]MBU9144916.1 hypothetical protein [Burkholderia multivorans]MBU9376321.1 hypothetical protein [Burkholderia multivorans]MBU9537157.1 hypothetical protein [Burkholderia multivorans]MDI3300042.1 hypothetical protein [Burkholderia multivorans]MDN7595294.1 hypothetical protein [Burkholderia multivorans]